MQKQFHGTAPPTRLIRTLRHRRENSAIYLAIAVLVVLAVWAAAFVMVGAERKARLNIDRLRAHDLAGGLEAHATGVFGYADTYLRSARREFRRRNSLTDLQDFLLDAPPNRAILSHVSLINADAQPVFISSGDPLKPNVTVSDRDYFQILKAATGDPVYISRPAYGRNSGLLTVRLARRIQAPQGQFAGVIFAAIEIAKLAGPFQSRNLGPNSAFGLIGLDRQVRLWSQSGEIVTDLDATDWPIWGTLDSADSGIFKVTGKVDGITRELAYRRLDGFPLLAIVGVAGIDAKAATAWYTRTTIAMALLVTLIIVVLVTSILRDMRMMRVLESEIAVRRRAEVMAVHATEIKTAFLATMSHEIRTPINAILGLFELIEQADVPERQKRQARAGQTAATDLFKQLTNVLDASRLEAKSLELTLRTEPVAPMIADLTQLLEAAIKNSGKPLTSSSQIEPDVPDTLVMDRRRVEQIVLNFIDNAVKFTETGEIKLGVCVLNTDDTPELCLSVRDTGPGLSKSDQRRLFMRFTQLDSMITRSAGGAGLGLSICKDLADLMHARLTVDSVEGEGTQFSLILRIESANPNSA